MGYNKEKLYKQALKVSENKNVYFIEDVVTLLPCSKQTFYDHFPVDSDEFDTIKANIEANKVSTKLELRTRLSEGDKAAEILALYKLIGTQEERKALSQNYTDHTTDGKKIDIPVLTWVKEEE